VYRVCITNTVLNVSYAVFQAHLPPVILHLSKLLMCRPHLCVGCTHRCGYAQSLKTRPTSHAPLLKPFEYTFLNSNAVTGCKSHLKNWWLRRAPTGAYIRLALFLAKILMKSLYVHMRVFHQTQYKFPAMQRFSSSQGACREMGASHDVVSVREVNADG